MSIALEGSLPAGLFAWRILVQIHDELPIDVISDQQTYRFTLLNDVAIEMRVRTDNSFQKHGQVSRLIENILGFLHRNRPVDLYLPLLL